MAVWNSMLLKIIIISSGVAEQHVRFIFKSNIVKGFLLDHKPS